MSKTYNKLVRDNIPDIIRAEGRECEVEIMDDVSFKQALLTKLIEEAQEIQRSNRDKIATEIADLYEVIDTIIQVFELSKNDITALQQERREARGAFKKRIKLVQTD